MKTQIKKELHSKSLSELRKQLKEVKDEVRVLGLDKQMGKLKNTSSLPLKRIEIAVISTIINEKLVIEQSMEVVKVDEKKEVSKKGKAVVVKANKKGGKK